MLENGSTLGGASHVFVSVTVHICPYTLALMLQMDLAYTGYMKILLISWRSSKLVIHFQVHVYRVLNSCLNPNRIKNHVTGSVLEPSQSTNHGIIDHTSNPTHLCICYKKYPPSSNLRLVIRINPSPPHHTKPHPPPSASANIDGCFHPRGQNSDI